MRYAVISDLHANLEAVDAVFAAIDRLQVDAVACLGDVVGYHADPEPVVERVRARVDCMVAGNHDLAVTASTIPGYFSARARRGIEWTRARLSPSSLEYLAALPITRELDVRAVLVHGALHPQPNADVRLSDEHAATASFAMMTRAWPNALIGFFGHIHLPLAYEWRSGSVRTLRQPLVELDPEARYLVNPGSVGQPRDGDARAAFLIYDTGRNTLQFHRVEFDHRRCQRKAVAAGLVERPTWRRRLRMALRRRAFS